MKEKQISSNIIVKLIYKIDNENKEYLFIIKKENDLSVDNAIKDFFKLNNITIIPPYYLYLKRNNIIKKELDKNEIITKINLKTNDEIIISSNKLIINLYEETIDSDNYINEKNYVQPTYETIYKKKDFNKRSIKNKTKINLTNNNNNKKTINKKLLLLFIAFGIFLLLVAASLVYVFLFYKKNKKDNKEEKAIVEKENLAIDIKYKLDVLYKYENNKMTKMSGGEGTNRYTKEIMQLADIFFIIEKEFDDDIKEQNLTKKWYRGFIGILNLTIRNKTDDILVIYDKKLNNILNENKNYQKPNLSYIGEEGNLCFAIIDFYKNGEIKDISYPKNNFSLSFMEYIKEYSQLIIPKISPDLYTENINDTLKEFEEEIDSDEFLNLRFLNSVKEKKSKIKKRIKRILSNDSSEEFEIEEYLTPSSYNSEGVELREKNNCTNCSENNLKEFSTRKFQSDEINIENSSINKTILRKINNESILESIIETENLILKNSLDEEESLEDDNDIYKESGTNNSNSNNDNINFKIDNMYLEKINQMNLTNKINKDKYIKKIYKYFDSFLYESLNESYYNDYINSELEDILKKDYNLTDDSIKITDEEESTNDNNNHNENKLRRTSNDDYYYGMKKIENHKDLYNYNLIGIKMKNQIYNEIIPSTGICNSYMIMNFGNKNIKIQSSEQYTNLHIILEKKNQMIFNLMNLVKQSNLDLKERNKNITAIILDLEKNLIDLYKDHDYSNLFRDSLNHIASQLNNINGEIFNELIDLINVVYDNYSLILDDVKNETYDIFQIIRNITKKEYGNYIYKMIDILGIFHNSTLLFLEDIQNEIENLTKIEKIDFLYDILDSIYDCKLILKQFNKNLFKSIEKGIVVFQSDINEFTENIIGDLLYITDYLSININKNEILIKTYDEITREKLSFKLKSIREIINLTFELLISNINSDYYNEMSVNNNESIKFYSELKSKIFLNETEIKSNEIIGNIKNKVKYIDLFDIYNDNLDFINYIHNKSIIEFIDNMYKNIVINITKLQPEYSNKNSDINKKRNNLFDISKSIVNKINNEITYISSYIKNYLIEYKEENIYNIYYNLYKLTELFLEKEMDSLLNELKNIITSTISLHKNTIDSNYKLGFDLLDELENEITVIHKKHKTYIGKGFFEKYEKFIENYNKYISSIFSDDSKILENLKNNYNKIKTEIITFCNNKLLSINNYGFESSIYKDNFNFIQKLNIKLSSIFEKIKIYFDDNRFSMFKSEVIQIFSNNLNNYNNEKLTSFTDIYSKIFDFTKGLSSTDEDFAYLKENFWTYIHFAKPKQKPITLQRTNNIDYFSMDISQQINYVDQNIGPVIANFKKKIDNYLPNYINYIQNIYKNLDLYLKNKIKNNDNIQILFNNYGNIFDNLLNVDSNYGLSQRLYNINISSNINYCIDNLEKNLKLLSKTYLNDYYLQNYQSFLEYPEEIKYKINYFDNVIKESINSIKQKINDLYKNKVINIIESTNYFISDMINSHCNYILIHLKKDDIIQDYYKSKYNLIINNFKEYSNKIDKLSKLNNDENFILSQQNYNDPLSNIFQNLKLFIIDFNNIIDNNFTDKNNENYFGNFSSNFDEENQNNSYFNETNITKYNYEQKLSKYNLTRKEKDILRTGFFCKSRMNQRVDKFFFNNLGSGVFEMSCYSFKIITKSNNEKEVEIVKNKLKCYANATKETEKKGWGILFWYRKKTTESRALTFGEIEKIKNEMKEKLRIKLLC